MSVFLDRVYGIILVECRDGNPNGDPDAGNRPRVDPVTGQGIITPMCTKRRMRDFAETHRSVTLYHRRGAILRDQRKLATDKAKLPTYKKSDKPGYEQLRDNQLAVCAVFLDARFFGAVMDLEEAKCANAAGPIWVSMGRSIDTVEVHDISITRQSREFADEAKENKTMGTLSVISYGLYRIEFEVIPVFAERTGFTEKDFAIFREMVLQCFEQDQAAHRKMDIQRVEVFRQCSTDGSPCLGHEHRAKLRNRLKVVKREGVETPSCYEDYEVTLDLKGLHKSIKHETWLA